MRKRRNGVEVRRLDALGRLGIPKIMRDGYEQYQEVEIRVEYGRICIKKFDRQNIKEREYIGIVRMCDRMWRTTIPPEILSVLKIQRESDLICKQMEDGTIEFIPIEELKIAE